MAETRQRARDRLEGEHREMDRRVAVQLNSGDVILFSMQDIYKARDVINGAIQGQERAGSPDDAEHIAAPANAGGPDNDGHGAELVCGHCTYRTGSKAHLDQHERYTHIGCICMWPGCAFEGEDDEEVRGHLVAAHFVDILVGGRYRCPWPGCDNKFVNRGGARRHVFFHNYDGQAQTDPASPEGSDGSGSSDGSDDSDDSDDSDSNDGSE